jgi:acetolactate synthase-1/2/3 large subunit
MNGAESLVRTLVESGVDTCFANPGTSEMHFVAALDKVEEMRCVLGMAETVVTGCADGYGRMAEKPAATLLHCGPGFANGMSNIHNARRAKTPMVNIVGDHATYHVAYDAPLTTDIEGMAHTVSNWVRTTPESAAVGADAALAVQQARSAPGHISTLILPADASWNEGGVVAKPLPIPAPRAADAPVVAAVAAILQRREVSVLLMSGRALTEAGLLAAQRVAQHTGARLLTTNQVPRMARGRGRVPVNRLPYALDAALSVLADVQHVILVGAKPPTQFFAYPGRPSLTAPANAQIHVLAEGAVDEVLALTQLAESLGAPKTVTVPVIGEAPQIVRGRFSPEAFGTTLAALMPEQAIVAEDAVTSGRPLFAQTYNAQPHDWLQLTGGSIGHGLPCAAGAAVACPDRQVVCLQADGAGMYPLQALWTQAREQLNVVNIIFANRVYKILQGELVAVGAQPGHASKALFDLARPELNWVKLAAGMGVEGVRVDTLEGFADVFSAACRRRGPFLIELMIQA